MKSINNILYLEFSDMTEAGIDANSIRVANYRQSKSWVFIQDPSDGRKLLVEFESLKDQYKKMIIDRFGNPYQQGFKTVVKGLVKTDFDAYVYFSTYLLPDGTGLPEKHIKAYARQAEWLNMLATANPRKEGFPDAATFYNTAISVLQEEKVELPSNYSRLKGKIREYFTTVGKNYDCLISKRFGNSNSQVITEDAADWIIAQYSLPIKIQIPRLHAMFNIEANLRGWKQMKDASTMYKFLESPEIKQQWYGARHGRLIAKEKYAYSMRTKLPEYRDALWYSDGTKLNYFDREGKLKAAYNVYFIIDAYSECVLGWHISKTENHEAQYKAAKMAIRTAGAKPYEWRYDNQGGHKKLAKKDDVSAEFPGGRSLFDKLTHVNFPVQPYNGKSKTIESLFNRFQQGVMRQDWFYTGQNITSKSMDSKYNKEFVIPNLRNLPSINQLIELMGQRIEEWNSAIHHQYAAPRKELYTSSINPHHCEVDPISMIDIFWLQRGPVTYYTSGITLEINKEKFEYEVIKDGMPDDDFRRKYIDQKFIIKYDPDDMTIVRLYLDSPDGLRYIASAQPRIIVPRAIVDYKEGDREMISKLVQYRKDEMEGFKKTTRLIEEKTGVRAKDLVLVPVQNRPRKTEKISESIGQVLKRESFQNDDEDDFFSRI